MNQLKNFSIKLGKKNQKIEQENPQKISSRRRKFSKNLKIWN